MGSPLKMSEMISSRLPEQTYRIPKWQCPSCINLIQFAQLPTCGQLEIPDRNGKTLDWTSKSVLDLRLCLQIAFSLELFKGFKQCFFNLGWSGRNMLSSFSRTRPRWEIGSWRTSTCRWPFLGRPFWAALRSVWGTTKLRKIVTWARLSWSAEAQKVLWYLKVTVLKVPQSSRLHDLAVNWWVVLNWAVHTRSIHGDSWLPIGQTIGFQSFGAFMEKKIEHMCPGGYTRKTHRHVFFSWWNIWKNTGVDRFIMIYTALLYLDLQVKDPKNQADVAMKLQLAALSNTFRFRPCIIANRSMDEFICFMQCQVFGDILTLRFADAINPVLDKLRELKVRDMIDGPAPEETSEWPVLLGTKVFAESVFFFYLTFKIFYQMMCFRANMAKKTSQLEHFSPDEVYQQRAESADRVWRDRSSQEPHRCLVCQSTREQPMPRHGFFQHFFAPFIFVVRFTVIICAFDRYLEGNVCYIQMFYPFYTIISQRVYIKIWSTN